MKMELLEAFGLSERVIGILKRKYGSELLPIQEKAIRAQGFLAGENFLILAPTSAGKTLIGEMLALTKVDQKKRVIYLVPTKALAEEKFEEFREDFSEIGINTVISTHDRKEFDFHIEKGSYHLAIVVYEKLLSLLVKKPTLLKELGLLLVDELQYIGDEERGLSLDLIITKALTQKEPIQIVGLSSVIGNPDSIARWLKAKVLMETKRPVELRKGVFFEGEFHYQEFNTGSEGKERWFLLNTGDQMEQLAQTAIFLGQKEQTVVFVKDKPTSEALGLKIWEMSEFSEAKGAIEELMDTEDSVSRELLSRLLERGIGLHHADLSREEREIIERYSRKGEIRVLVCTSTLAVGLNLPMKNAIIEPSKWFFDKKTRSLAVVGIPPSEYENMGGRVGRYGYVQDFGRSVLITNSYVDFMALYKKYVKGKVEELNPKADRERFEKYLHSLIGTGFCRSQDELKQFLESTFGAREAKAAEDIGTLVATCLRFGLIKELPGGGFEPTEIGKIISARGITLETAFHFLNFLKERDPYQVSEMELLTLIALSKDAYDVYIPMKTKEKGYRGYRYELQRVVAYESEEGKPIYTEIFKGSGRLAYEEERAIKKALMMREWISGRDTKEIENSFFVYSGVIKRVGEDFSWLCEALYDLSKECGWPAEVTERISVLSEKLAYGLPEKALTLGRMRVKGLGRGHMLRLVKEGIDSEEAIRELTEKELERHIPKRLAVKLKQRLSTPTPKQTGPAEGPRELIRLDRNQNRFYFRGVLIPLPPISFKMLSVLCERPKQVVRKEELYSLLYPDSGQMPYERQISDHKRKITSQIKKCLKEGVSKEELKGLIKTIHKIGYLLDVDQKEIVVE